MANPKKCDDASSKKSHEDPIAANDPALFAKNDLEDGSEKHPMPHIKGGNHLFAGLSLRDQIALGHKPAVEHGWDPAGRRTIDFEVNAARQARLFGMVARQKAVLHVTCLGTDGEWQRLRVRKVIWKLRRA